MIVEMRSDTFTKPTSGMLEAMVNAELGDDMVGEDPTVNRFEARIAELLGKEAAVFACSGTQSNQMGVWTHTQRGEELLIESTGHIANYEAGAPAVLSGVTCLKIPGDFGRLSVEHLEGTIRGSNQHFARTSLLCLENSTNMGGGRTYPLEQIQEVCNWAHENNLKTHLDGARIFNACVARDYSIADVAANFDTISICFSKGLGCPMGSVLVGSSDDIAKARRARKLFGGSLRQAGLPAAACEYALDHHVNRLAEDHANAKLFAELITEIDGIHIDVSAVETNLVFFEVDPSWGTAAQLSTVLKSLGIHINPAFKTYRLRACTHLGVSEEQIHMASEAIREALSSSPTEQTVRAVGY